jgi:VWFA-related protein
VTRRLALAACLAIAAGSEGPSARQQAGQRDRPAVVSTATAILVDVVVRDRNGRPVTNLDASDFALAEDGVPHHIDSFSRVSRGGIGVSVAWRAPGTTVVNPTGAATTAAPADPANATTDVTGEAGVTAIVFDQLTPESLRLAQKATLEYVPMNGTSAVRVGVFATDPGIRVLQGFTHDRTLVRRAVANVLPSGVSAGEQKAERTDQLMERRRELHSQGDPTAGGATASTATLAQNAAALGLRENELRMIQTELNMIRASDHLDREHRGYDTTFALLTVVRSLSSYPGRKTIVFFSEGLPASPVLSAKLDTIIDAANRANVTAYAIDAHGLRSKSSAIAMKKEMEAFVEERFRQLATGADRTEQPLSMDFERVEDTLRLDSKTGLARLAGDTGGFLVEQSNDLSAAFRRIDEDTQFHYLLTYSPLNTAFDGRFRTIQVKVRRPGLQVFARKGYRVLRRPGMADALDDETAAAAMLDRSPLPNAFAIHAATFSFPDPARPGLMPVLVQVATDRLRLEPDARRATYTGDATIVVRIRDGQGREVQKTSQQYVLSGDLKDVDAARRGEILFYRELDVAPGIYTAESIVFDALAGTASARIATVTVPAVEGSGLAMSSLVLVRRVEELSDAPTRKDGTAPLYVGNRLLYPNIGEPISRSATQELPFYFVLYGDVAGIKVHAQLLRGGVTLADAPVDVPASTGRRVQHVGRLPISRLPAGTYELRLRVNDGRHEQARAVFFTLVE